MVFRLAGQAPGGNRFFAFFLTGVVTTAALIGCATTPAANAKTKRPPAGVDGGTGNGTGNGRNNRTIHAPNSSPRNRGYQHTLTATAGGATSVQNALCRRVKICNITQQITMVLPTPTAQPTRTPAPSPAARTPSATLASTPSPEAFRCHAAPPRLGLSIRLFAPLL